MSVFNANSYFLATANLLVFTDHGRRQVSGGLLSNTLAAAPTPVIKENIKTDAAGTTFTGSIAVAANRQFAITGYVDTSHGRIVTTLEQSIGYLNTQQFDVSPSQDVQNVQQLTTVESHVTTRGAGLESSREQQLSYPLKINYTFVFNPDGTVTQTTVIDQRALEFSGSFPGGATSFASERALDRHAQLRRQWQLPGSLGQPGERRLCRARTRMAASAVRLPRRRRSSRR